MTVLERAIKLAFVDPEDSSEYTRAWSHYYIASSTNPGTQIPPAWLDQPKYRCPKDYAETKLGLDQLISGMGAEGIFPVDRRRNAELDGSPNPVITSLIIMLVRRARFYISSWLMQGPASSILHNQHAITRHQLARLREQGGVERCSQDYRVDATPPSVGMCIKTCPLQMLTACGQPLVDVDSFQVVLWSMVAKVFIKEMHRLRLAGDVQGEWRFLSSICDADCWAGSAAVEEEANVIILEMYRIGAVMQLA